VAKESGGNFFKGEQGLELAQPAAEITDYVPYRLQVALQLLLHLFVGRALCLLQAFNMLP
jgi:hypothetical protein